MTKIFGMVLAVSLSICPIGTYATGEDIDSILEAARKFGDSHKRAVIDRVKSTVEAEKAGLPKKLDDLTTLFLVNFREVPTVRYIYTLKVTKQQTAGKQAVWDELAQHLIQEVCSKESATAFLEIGGAYTFDYISHKGVPLSKVKVDSGDCLLRTVK